MIKYFCDFCKEEIPMMGPKPDTEINVTVIKSLSPNNRTSQKVEHVCDACNQSLITKISEMGYEVI